MANKNELGALIADVSEHLRYLRELGVETLEADLPEPMDAASTAEQMPRISVRPEANIPFAKPPVKMPQPPPKPRGSRSSSLPSLKKRPAVTISKSERNNDAVEADKVVTNARAAAEPKPSATMTADTKDTIESIRAEIGDCTRCPLHAGRIQIVHTTGNFKADLMFIGEAPGADEDEQGSPFVGRAGRLLTDIIKAMGFDRESVCIGNINRCRPPDNRKPEPVETAACRPFLLREIAVVDPKVIVVLGATAAHNLLQVKTPITKLRGQFHDYFGVKVMPTFHPAYLLRDPHKKKEVWEDMKKVRDLLQG